jgi:predicted AAA+ superfamily ATPase
MELPRHERRAIEESLTAFPVVLLTGARQVGKTTLARNIATGSWRARYRTLDDPLVREAVRHDPDGFLAAEGAPLVLDEVQAAPDLLRAIKLRVDRDREAGQYLLTGSANLLALRRVTESLAGRVAVHELGPLSWSELDGQPAPRWTFDDLFRLQSPYDLEARIGQPRDPDDLRRRILTGGYPTPALTATRAVRTRWFESYVRTYVQRDIPDLAGIEYLGVFERLLRLLMLRTGNLLNVSDVARALGVPPTTAHRYVDLLVATYQAAVLSPWAGNTEKRVVKTPKVYGGDSGLTAWLSGARDWDDLERDGRTGALVETWVFGELKHRAQLAETGLALSFWRTHGGHEVDFVVERGSRAIGIAVKSGARVDRVDFRGLEAFADSRPLQLRLVLYGGTSIVPFGDGRIAVPASAFFL